MRLYASALLAMVMAGWFGAAQAQQPFVPGSSVLSSGTVSPRTTCPSPNPNIQGPPNFMDGCPLPAAGLNLVAPLNSPNLTGTPTAPTPSSGDNSTKIATTGFVNAPSGVTAGCYTISGYALTVATNGEITSLVSGNCGGVPAIITGGGNTLTCGGVTCGG